MTVLITLRIGAPRIRRKRSKLVAPTMRRLWRAYCDYQLRRATVVMRERLDDRALADIGIDRNEIESLINELTRDRARRCGRLA
jgi:uncharacterized protein YjiS (DUF1127 family)